jgi:hypothetical protein
MNAADVRAGRLLSNNLIIEEDLTPQIDGIIAEFTIANNYSFGTMMVYLNGLRQKKGIGKDYVEVSPNKIEFDIPPENGDELLVDYVKI